MSNSVETQISMHDKRLLKDSIRIKGKVMKTLTQEMCVLNPCSLGRSGNERAGAGSEDESGHPQDAEQGLIQFSSTLRIASSLRSWLLIVTASPSLNYSEQVLVTQGDISAMNGCISTGKEANVYHCTSEYGDR